MTHHIVVSRFAEDPSWIDDFNIENYKIFLYNKSAKPINYPSIRLENKGREADTYLNYIIDNYNNLADYNWFFQGNPFSHYFHLFKDLINDVFDFDIKALSYSRSVYVNKDVHWDELKNTKYIHEYYEILGEDVYRDCLNLGAQFIVNRKTILKRPLDFYKKLLSLLDKDDQGPWIMERFWIDVFLCNREYDLRIHDDIAKYYIKD